jgi:hypothetical protein
VPQPCIPIPGNPGDELTTGLDCISENLVYLQYQLSQLAAQLTGQPGQPVNPDPVTCAQLSGLVNVTNAWLAAISQAITAASTGAGAPIDLTAVVQQLTAIAVGTNQVPPSINAAAAAIAAPLNALATAAANNPAVDLTAVVKALQALFQTIDIPPAVVQSLVNAGYLSPDALATIGQGDFGDVLITTIVNFAYKALVNYLGFLGVEIVGGVPSYVGFKKSLSDEAARTFSEALNDRDAVITPIVQGLVKLITTDLKPPGATQIGVINVNADKPVADAIGIAFAAQLVAYGLAFVGIDEGESLAQMAEIVAGAVGFEQLRDVQIGPLIRNGIGKLADMQAKATFKQEIPGTDQLGTLVAMGLLDPTRRDAIAQFNGTPDELAPMIAKAQYRGFNARQMLRLIETDLFSQAEIADELTFSAMRPASQARMLRAAPYLATAPQRSALVAAIEAAAVAGLLSDADVTAQVDAAQQSEDRDSLILARLHLQQLVAETKDLETEYTTLFVASVIDDVTFRNSLAAIGLQPWKVNTVAAKAEARANATLHRKEIAAATAAAKALQKEIDQVAVKNFLEGNIDAAALAAALIASGVTPTQAASMVDLAVLRKGGALRWVYGLQLSPTAATLLRNRVTALTDQRKRLQITEAQYVSQLQALGIGDRYVNALDAAAEAMISPKTSAFAIPVKTN